MLLYLVVIGGVLCVLHILLNYNERARMFRKIPGPEYDFIVGNAFKIICSPVRLMKLRCEFASSYNGIYRIWVHPYGSVVIYNPDDIEIIMSSPKYNDKSFVYKILRPWLRGGLLLSNGSKWQERRKILTPSFHFNILRQFFDVINENSQRLIERLKRSAGKPIDITPVLSEYTLNSICETAMGTQLNEDTSEGGKSYKKSIYSLGSLFTQRFMKVFLYSDFIFNLTTYKTKQSNHLETVHNFTKRVIQNRREYIAKHGIMESVADDELYVYKRKKKTAMLDLLISAEKEGLIDNEGIQEEVDTFMFEGHDTTASGLTFCFMLLANHKDVQDKIVYELNNIFGESKREVTIEDLQKMKYMECCIKESLRLYPPVHFIGRTLKYPTVLSNAIYLTDSSHFYLGNYKIPARSMCHISIFDLHRRSELFKDPEKFDPDRFLPENSVGRHPYSYIPFSAGPRNCIGQKFAIMEMKIAIAEILRHFELEPVTRPADVVFTADLILRNNGPVNVTFAKRHIG